MQDPNELLKKIIDDAQKVLQNAPAIIGRAAMGHYQESFRRQSWEGKLWDGRKNPDKNEQKRGQRALLVSSEAMLWRSFEIKLNGVSVVITNTRKYAQIHNEGGKIAQTPTDKQRAFFWHQYYAHIVKKKGRGKAKGTVIVDDSAAQKWKFMALTKQLNIEIPQRQFMDIPKMPPSKGTLDEINRQLDNEIKRILK
jgi:phage gpG-like protein